MLTHRRHGLRRARRQYPIGRLYVFAMDVLVKRRQHESESASFGITQDLTFNPIPPCSQIVIFLAEKMLYCFFHWREYQMPRTNLSAMSVEQLLKLRDDVGKELNRKTVELRKQLARLGSEVAPSRRGRGASALRGRKVPPKYRGPSGETWAGRGAKPRWLVAAIKGGKKLDHFLIDKSAGKGRKKRRSKR